MNRQRHTAPGATRLAGRVETTPRRLGGAAPPSSPLLQPGDPPTGRERIRLFPNRQPSNCRRSAGLSPVPCHPSGRQFVPIAVGGSAAGPASAILKSKKTPMISQKSRLIQPNPTKSPTPQSDLSSGLPRRSPAEAAGPAREDLDRFRVPNASQLCGPGHTRQRLELRRLQRLFGPGGLMGCGFQLHLPRVSGLRSQVSSLRFVRSTVSPVYRNTGPAVTCHPSRAPGPAALCGPARISLAVPRPRAPLVAPKPGVGGSRSSQS